MKEWMDEKTGNIYCPVNGWDCPYYDKENGGACNLSHVESECDDFYWFWGDEIDEARERGLDI